MSERLIKILVPLWVFAVLATQGSAATLVVDGSGGGDYASIADAVGGSTPGDTLLIRAGVYEEGDITLSHGLTIRGEDRELCVIDGRHETQLFLCHLLEGTEGTVAFEHLTMRRGYSPHEGGAMDWSCGRSAELTARDVTFRENRSSGGGVVWIWSCEAASFEDCLFEANESTVGAVASIQGSCPTSFLNCTMTRNTGLGGMGTSVIMVQASTLVRLEGCSLTQNGSTEGMSNVLFFLDSPAEIVGCTIAGNLSAPGGMAVVSTYQPEPGRMENTIVAFNEGMIPSGGEYEFMQMTDCCIFANAENDSVTCQETNCERVDPRFCGLDSGDFTLCADSPCLPGVGGWGALVGAEEQGCSACGSAVVPASWGVIKAMYMGDVRLPN